MKKNKLKRHPLATGSFWLCIFTMILPTEADLIFMLLNAGKYFQALIAKLIFTVIIGSPLLFSYIQTKKHPEKWQAYGLIKATFVILCFNAAVYGYVFWKFLIK